MFGFSKEVLAQAVKKGAGSVKKISKKAVNNIRQSYKDLPQGKTVDSPPEYTSFDGTANEGLPAGYEQGRYQGSQIPVGQKPRYPGEPQARPGNLPVPMEMAGSMSNTDRMNRALVAGGSAVGLGAVGGAMAGNAVGQEQGQQQVVDAMQQQQEQQLQQAMQQAILSSLNAKQGTLSWNALAKNLSQINPELDAITYEEAQMLAQQVSGQLGIPLQVVR
jgi:hypothetical protein